MPNSLPVYTIERDQLAKQIADYYFKWNQGRSAWLGEKKELREHLFATDTKKTSNSALPWKNSTVTPKLTQIRDNLHANYMAALFPSEEWFVWEGAEKDAVTKDKRDKIQAYMKSKLKASGFDLLVSQLIYDYIDYGNSFAGHEFVTEYTKDEMGNPVVSYIGPKAFRTSPLDIVFDPTAESFIKSPKIIRQVKSFGDLLKDIKTKPHLQYKQSAVDKALGYRRNIKDYNDYLKDAGWIVDGFRTLEEYYQSYNVEILHFWGDLYDATTNTLYENQVISVIDRCHILRQFDNPSWLGTDPYRHVGWRLRPDNLWAQGPLDQLIGMQYRIDHLENLKADVFDQIAHPITKIMGTTVEDFQFGPGVEIFCGDEGDVEFMRPEAQALTADMQIADLMNKMEEMAGAPRQAMGIRTPGEKTKYEVQVLENGAGRIFQAKVNWFEKNLIEPLLNSMLEEARRNLTGADTIKLVDPDSGAAQFMDITKDDIIAKGKLYAIGARHFAEQARFVQDLTTTLQLLQQMPTVLPHISGKQVAKALEEGLGWTRWHIVSPNIAVAEQKETQALMNSAQDQLTNESMIPTEIQPGDMNAPSTTAQQTPLS